MSQYVYAVNGDCNVTVLTGFNCKVERFFADVYSGENTDVDPIHSWEARSEREIAAMLESMGIPMHMDAFSQMSRDSTDSIFDQTETERRFNVFSTLTVLNYGRGQQMMCARTSCMVQ